MNTVSQRLKNEFMEFISPAIFFLVAFQLLAFTQSMMLKGYGIRTSVWLAAVIGALIVAKVVLLLDHVPFINRFPDKPLIYNVVWKTMLYAIAAILARYGERLFHYFRETGDLAKANRQLLSEVVWPHFWAVQMWLLVMLLVYCSLRELSRALGRDRVRKMFFSDPHSAM